MEVSHKWANHYLYKVNKNEWRKGKMIVVD